MAENKENDKKEMIVQSSGVVAIPRTGLSVKGELAVKGELTAIYELANRGELAVKGELSKDTESDRIIIVESIKAAVDYLKDTTGNILTTTGALEIYEYTKLDNYADRLYSRVISNSGIIAACEGLGIKGRHLIGMTGPFSKEMNKVMLKDYNIQYLVTKDSGISSGFIEKMEAALESGVTMIVVAAPYQKETGREEEVVKQLKDMAN